MLKAEIDVEVIKSAMLAGEVDDAVNYIRKAMSKIEVYRRVTKSSKQDARYKFLEAILTYLSGDEDTGSFRETVEKISGIRSDLVPHGDFDKFMDTLIYYLQLTSDRYNVRYPSFDGKRCDDK